MLSKKPLGRILAILISLGTLTAPLAAQQKAPPVRPSPAAPAKAPAKNPLNEPVTIESLLSADAYKIYGEVKNVGTLVSTGSIAELIDPVMKLADPPKEFRTLVKFINANAEMLADSRLVFAAWPARPGIPDALVAIELASPEDAAKFEPKLNRLLPTILPTPTPTPSPEEEKPKTGATTTPAKEIRTVAEPGTPIEDPKPAPPPFVVSRSGNLVFVTSRPFKFEKLRPKDSKLLAEDQSFRSAHERLSTEPVFVFVNLSLQDLNQPPPTPSPTVDAAEEARRIAEEEAEARKAAEATDVQTDTPVEVLPVPESSPPATGQFVVKEQSTATLSARVEPAPGPTQPQVSMMAVGSLMGLITGGPPEWPDAIGIAVSQEADDYVVRSILIGPQNSKRPLLPFAPQLLAGRSFAPNAPSILPDDTELLVSMSIDFPRTYQEMQARLEVSHKEQLERFRKIPASDRTEADEKPYDPFRDFETNGHFKIKDELVPALGNEIAIAGSLRALQGGLPFGIGVVAPGRPPSDNKDTEESRAQKKRDQESSPVVLIGVKDREAARRLMPKVLDGLGAGMANMIATPVRREDTEMVDFAGAFAYAFVGDFVVISTTPTVRHLIDSYLTHQTLSSNPAYRNFTRWQPSGIVGQVYVSPALMEEYQKAAHDPSPTISASMREYLLRLNPTPQAMTYALSNDGNGALHELHLPKAFVLASIAGVASVSKEPPPEMNEAVAVGLLQMVAGAEASYKNGEGKGSYASLDKLIAAKLVQQDVLDKYGYRFEVVVSGNHFEATAVPVEYGKTGRLSYFIDESGVVRGGDHGGGSASAADKPVQ